MTPPRPRGDELRAPARVRERGVGGEDSVAASSGPSDPPGAPAGQSVPVSP